MIYLTPAVVGRLSLRSDGVYGAMGVAKKTTPTNRRHCERSEAICLLSVIIYSVEKVSKFHETGIALQMLF